MTNTKEKNAFRALGIEKMPVILAPLAGVSDHPFRRICEAKGADLTYVEMISATALLYESGRTLRMLKRHPSEARLGIQVTGRSAEDVGRAVEILDKYEFDTIDINMGCPVRKVVKTGCGSAILRDPERVYQSVRLARQATAKPLSAKIRLGWDRSSLNGVEIAQAIAAGGADWLVVHGRTRADDYSVPVDLDYIGEICRAVSLPVIGNGNLFSSEDVAYMKRHTGVAGVMISRGALGDPWLFREVKSGAKELGLEEWLSTVQDHLAWQLAEYGELGAGAVCMRKHLLWYTKGWPGGKFLREQINKSASLGDIRGLLDDFVKQLTKEGVEKRLTSLHSDQEQRFSWDPKWDMDRRLDRGLSDEAQGMEEKEARAPYGV